MLVAGGSGAFFGVANLVIAVNRYVPRDVTQQARTLVGTQATQPQKLVFNALQARKPTSVTLGPPKDDRPAKALGRATIRYGGDTIDLSAVSQLVDAEQTQAIARALDRLSNTLDDRASVSDRLDELLRRIDQEGLDWLWPHPGHPGYLARPRPYELQAAIRRCRRLRIQT